MKDIESFSGIRLGPGTLYGAITRLEERGFIQALEADDRRRPYRISASGQLVLRKSLDDLRQIVDEGKKRLRVSAVISPLSPTSSTSAGTFA